MGLSSMLGNTGLSQNEKRHLVVLQQERSNNHQKISSSYSIAKIDDHNSNNNNDNGYVVDFDKRQRFSRRKELRKLVEENTSCHHKTVYTHANFICKMISPLYERGTISAQQALQLMLFVHDESGHKGRSKRSVIKDVEAQIQRM